tara:strand:+ start:275 stop:469 length:195 start_codon:yes stop_codon:yes gene_type:complete
MLVLLVQVQVTQVHKVGVLVEVLETTEAVGVVEEVVLVLVMVVMGEILALVEELVGETMEVLTE